MVVFPVGDPRRGHGADGVVQVQEPLFCHLHIEGSNSGTITETQIYKLAVLWLKISLVLRGMIHCMYIHLQMAPDLGFTV